MGRVFEFRAYGVPETQGSMRQMRGRVFHSRRGALESWRRHVTAQARCAVRDCLDWPVEVEAVFYLPRPKRPRWSVPATGKDLDKLARALGDALSPRDGRGVLVNDSRIVAWRVSKEWASRKCDPGVFVRITEWEKEVPE
ncbi:RusA family crossover junction endodeoxyribonuclease [Dermabacteraceae bacterium P13088]